MAVIELDLNPAARLLRVFGLAAFVAFAILAYVTHAQGSLPGSLVATFAALALLSGVFAVLKPAWNRPLYVVLSLLAYPVGLVLSYLVLGVIFYLVLTPVGAVFRMVGRDPLRRRRPRDVDTYWVARACAPPPERYFRQF